MDKAITTKQQVSLRQKVLQNVKSDEFPAWAGVFSKILLNDQINDVGARIINAKVQSTHPVEIATWNIQYRADSKICNKLGYRFANLLGHP